MDIGVKVFLDDGGTDTTTLKALLNAGQDGFDPVELGKLYNDKYLRNTYTLAENNITFSEYFFYNYEINNCVFTIEDKTLTLTGTNVDIWDDDEDGDSTETYTLILTFEAVSSPAGSEILSVPDLPNYT